MALSFKLSKSVLSTISPPIPAAYKWVCKTGRSLLDMSQGVPGTAPHTLLQQSLRETALRQDAWGYCPAEGETSLREAIAKEMKIVYQDPEVDLTPSDIAVTSGCNLAFVAVIMAIADAGDEVILPVPWYFNHQMTLTLLGITPVCLSTPPSSHFLPSPTLAASLITQKTRAIALVTPNNPTGAEYPPSLISEFAHLAHERGIALILDETYRDFLVPERPPHSLFSKSSKSSPEESWRSSIISLYSFSKSYRIPGHRLGAITASPTLLKEIVKVLDTLQICAPRLPQLSLVLSTSSDGSASTSTVLSALRPDILSTAQAIDARHRLFKDTLAKEAPKWQIASQGAYYAFVRHPFSGRGSEEVCQRLVEEVGVRVLPGAFFFDSSGVSVSDSIRSSEGHLTTSTEELDRYIRFSVANVSDEKVVQVCQRLGEAETMFRDKFGWEMLRG